MKLNKTQKSDVCLIKGEQEMKMKMTEEETKELGYNKANEWHDLRKDPNDLPESSIFHEVLNQNGTKIYYDDVLKKWNMYFNGEIIQAQTPIAWCEIPKFEE